MTEIQPRQKPPVEWRVFYNEEYRGTIMESNEDNARCAAGTFIRLREELDPDLLEVVPVK